MHPRLLFILLPALFGIARLAAQNTAPAATAPQQQAAVPEPIQGAWYTAGAGQSMRTEREYLDVGMTVQGNWNALRQTRNEMLATRSGQLLPEDREQLRLRADDLARMAPNSFEAHMARYYAEFPATAAMEALSAAYQVAPDRTELAGPMLGAALRNGDKAGVDQWATRLAAPGMVTNPLLDYATDLLASVDRNAVIFTNGDLDTYPALVRVHAGRVRPDVLIIDRRSLNDAAYRQRCWKDAGAKGQAPADDPRFASQLAVATDRPVYLAASMERGWLDALSPQLYCTGLAFRVGPAPADHMRALEQRWKALHKTTEAGPLSRNYLMPGSLLLQHYRAAGDEGRTAAMEHELRQLAKRIGALDRLYQAGVLTH
ncbi:MAG: hypothetical protein JNM31_01075 [Flavobacteriales bacterium]|nr:hypothetical protein [Flavobacteriales bacterium]